MTPVQATDADRGTWRELLAADGDALVTQSPEWIDALCADGGYEDVTRLYETAGGRRLVLPMVRKRGPWPASRAFRGSMPSACGMGGLVAESRPQPEEMAAVAADLAADPALRTGVRPNPLHADEWAGVAGNGVVDHPPPRPRDRPHGRGRGSLESATRQARTGLSARPSGRGWRSAAVPTGTLVPVFYELLEQSVVRWAATQHEPVALARWRASPARPAVEVRGAGGAIGRGDEGVGGLQGRRAGRGYRGAVGRQRQLHPRRDEQGARRADQGQRPAAVARHPGRLPRPAAGPTTWASRGTRVRWRTSRRSSAPGPYDYRELPLRAPARSAGWRRIPRTVAKRLLRFRDV